MLERPVPLAQGNTKVIAGIAYGNTRDAQVGEVTHTLTNPNDRINQLLYAEISKYDIYQAVLSHLFPMFHS